GGGLGGGGGGGGEGRGGGGARRDRLGLGRGVRRSSRSRNNMVGSFAGRSAREWRRQRRRRADRAPGRCRAGGGLLGGKDPAGRLRFGSQSPRAGRGCTPLIQRGTFRLRVLPFGPPASRRVPRASLG